MTRRRKYKRLLFWRDFIKQVNKSTCEANGPLTKLICGLSCVESYRSESTAFELSIRIRLPDGTEIFEWDRFTKDPLRVAAFKIYLWNTQKIMNQ